MSKLVNNDVHKIFSELQWIVDMNSAPTAEGPYWEVTCTTTPARTMQVRARNVSIEVRSCDDYTWHVQMNWSEHQVSVAEAVAFAHNLTTGINIASALRRYLCDKFPTVVIF